MHVPAGGFAFGPRGVPHAYAVTSNVARLLIITTPGGAEHFFRELGKPAEALVLPVPAPPTSPGSSRWPPSTASPFFRRRRPEPAPAGYLRWVVDHNEPE